MTCAKTLGIDFAFGIDKDGVAAHLQYLAHEIRAGRIIPQQITVTTKADASDFELVRLKLTYAAPRA